MISLSPYTVLQAVVNDEAATLTDETAIEHTFSDRFVEAATVLSSYGDQNQTNNAIMCAFGLLSWPAEKRQSFLESYDVPGRVVSYLSNPPAWPWVNEEEQTDAPNN